MQDLYQLKVLFVRQLLLHSQTFRFLRLGIDTRPMCDENVWSCLLFRFRLPPPEQCWSPAGGIEDYCSLFPGNEKSIIWNLVLLFERQNRAHIFLLIRSHTALGKVIKRRFSKTSNGPIYTPRVVQMSSCSCMSPARMYECLVAYLVNSGILREY